MKRPHRYYSIGGIIFKRLKFSDRFFLQKLQPESENRSFNPSLHTMTKIFFVPFFLILFAVSGCGFQKKPKECDVLVSIPPYLYFIDKLTDGELKVESLVPAGANPHLYEPSPKQVAKARQAKVWIRLSEGFEQKILTSLKEQNSNLIVVNLAKDLNLPELPSENGSCSCCKHHHHESSKDLHFWLSLRLAKNQASLIADALCTAFPEKEKQIRANLCKLQESFEETDITLTKALAPYAGQSILVSHSAFAYFCYDYRLKQISIEQEGKDPLPQQITSIIQSATTNQIRTVLTQAQYNNKGALIIAEKLHLAAHEVDPYAADYLTNILFIAKCIENP